ncbi:complement component C1q receptor [Anguilla anguilla]|uniref:complement component C1q receptor n=1 Tax=Anguilla anguilla TaxID=7936 RepID=UPI0015B15737|nr:complement component C1q receptor [Anguilla anguilla]
MAMIFLLLLLQLLHGTDGAEREPAEIACATSACYTVHIENSTYEEAKKNCEDNGGKLATIKDQAEAGEVRSVLSRFGRSDIPQSFKFWIGLKLQKGSCIFPEGSLKGFTWISGEHDTEYSSWEKEPEITCTEERCVSVHHTSSQKESGSWVLWTDRSCKDVAGFVCKFNFKGMCKPLLLAGPGTVRYNTPFVRSPLSDDSVLTMLPHGTVAEVSCSGDAQYTSCKDMNGFFGWAKSGPFCDSSNQGCKYKNGGCDHYCIDSDHRGVRCECKNGFELGEDSVTCVHKDNCKDSPCKFKCVPTTTGFTCACPAGFELAKDQISCTDVDECSSPVCGSHTCHNTQGSYTCHCKTGYRSISGKCEDIDECLASPCPQGCLNSPGSYSCYCFSGYRPAKDGRGCVDDDECLISPCAQNCTNTPGSFKCSCSKHFRIAANGVTCIPDPQGEFPAHQGEQREKVWQKTDGHINTPEATIATVSTPRYDTILTNNFPDESTSVVYNGASSATTTLLSEVNEDTVHTNNSVRQVNNLSKTWILACTLGSVAALLLVIAVISVIVVCRSNRLRKDAKKQNSTTDSYCWVSPGNVTQLEKPEEQK